ncbi:MAG: TetR/AcrR family transcriptional regulator [Myxococcota bacterium]
MRDQNLKRRAEIGRERRARTRAQLVEAALRVFAGKGLDAATTQDFYEEAGVSRGTFYNYFETKEDVLTAVANRLADALNEEILSETEGVEGAPERVAWTVERFVGRALTHPGPSQVMVDIAARQALILIGETSEGNMRADLETGRAQGLFTIEDDEMAANIIVGVSMQAIRSILAGRAGPEHVYLAARSVLLAYGTPQARAESAARFVFDRSRERT